MKDEKRKPSQVFARRLREIRKNRRLTQAEVAERMSRAGRPMSKTAIVRLERGERGVSLDEAIALIAVLWAVPANLLAPAPGEGTVWLTDNFGDLDGAAMRAWLRYGDSFLADSGDLPEELVADRARQAVFVQAQALVDANRKGDKAGIQEAYRAMEAVFQPEYRERIANPPAPYEELEAVAMETRSFEVAGRARVFEQEPGSKIDGEVRTLATGEQILVVGRQWAVLGPLLDGGLLVAIDDAQ